MPVARLDFLGADHRVDADEAGDEGVGGGLEQLARRSDLLDLAIAENRRAVAQRQRFLLIMGDGEERRAEAAVEPADLVAELLAELLVEAGQRLVEKKDGRLEHERTGERHPLPLAAGELVHPPRFVALQRDDAEHVADAAVAHRGIDATDA